MTSSLADRDSVTKVFSQRECYGDNLRIYSRNDSREDLQRGTPAVCLTIDDIIENRKKKLPEKIARKKLRRVERQSRNRERRKSAETSKLYVQSQVPVVAIRS